MEQYHETILVVEDDVQIRNFICYALKAEGFRCVTAGNAATAMKQLLAEPVDMMLLDLGLPDMDGGEVLKKVREWSEMPIIIVSARDQDREKAAMLDLGADDYLTKPFELEELWVRILVQLRHRGNAGGEKELTFKDWTIDPQARILTAGGKAVELTAHELGIVELLMRHPKKVFTRQEIYEAVWQQDAFIEDKTINVHVSNIRAKLRSAGAGDYISTVWGIGFKLTE